MDEGVSISGATCAIGGPDPTSGDREPFGAEWSCELVILPVSRLLFVKVLVDTGLEDFIYPIPIDSAYAPAGALTGKRVELVIRLSELTVFARPPGTDAKALVEQAAHAMTASLSPPEAKTIRVDFSALCHKEDSWETSGAPANSSVLVNWNAAVHHLTMSVSHHKKSMSKADVADYGEMSVEELEESLLLLGSPVAESYTVDAPPPSCYVDSSASADCAQYEPHVSRLREVLGCLGLPLDTADEQNIAADFLRRFTFRMREPVAPVELLMKAFWDLQGAKKDKVFMSQGRQTPTGGPTAFRLPGAIGKCLGINSADAEASQQLAAAACYLPMASVTGSGYLSQGSIDETTLELGRASSKAVILLGDFREPSGKEAARDPKRYSGKLVSTGPGTRHRLDASTVPIAEIRAPSMCARIVFDRLRRLSFLPNDKFAWWGNSREPIKSLRPSNLSSCIQGVNPGGDNGFTKSTGINCRFYVGCALRLMADFDKIPGLSRKAVAYCTDPLRHLRETYPSWILEDNAYWMRIKVGHATVSVPEVVDFWQRRVVASNRTKAYQEPPSLDGFHVGDVVRVHKEGVPVHGRLYIVSDVAGGPKHDRICVRRGQAGSKSEQIHCYASAHLEHVPATEWDLEAGTGLPVPAP